MPPSGKFLIASEATLSQIITGKSLFSLPLVFSCSFTLFHRHSSGHRRPMTVTYHASHTLSLWSKLQLTTFIESKCTSCQCNKWAKENKKCLISTNGVITETAFKIRVCKWLQSAFVIIYVHYHAICMYHSSIGYSIQQYLLLKILSNSFCCILCKSLVKFSNRKLSNIFFNMHAA